MTNDILIFMTSKELVLYIGGKVKARRKYLNLSRKELSVNCGVSEATLGRLENRGTATLHVLVKVAIALNSLDTLQELFRSPKASSLAELRKQVNGNA